MDPEQWVDIKEATDIFERRFQYRPQRGTISKWIEAGYLPASRKVGGKWVLIPRAAAELFEPPSRGVGRRVHLARGIGLALRVLGKATVPAQDGRVGWLCPRCGQPWVIDGARKVVGEEHDLCCCNWQCLYIGPDFIQRADPRTYRCAENVCMVV